MKSKTILLVAGVAIITLSFTFATTRTAAKKEIKQTAQSQTSNEPIGGLLSEDEI